MQAGWNSIGSAPCPLDSRRHEAYHSNHSITPSIFLIGWVVFCFSVL